ncbi:MAG: DoxX family protein [Flavobacteriaceae bacterium]|jgi:putative oxidoreductase|nr:DoxX family protein [Flavobacteriaceae bacterium]
MNVNLGQFLLRLTVGILMLPHGIFKLINGHEKIIEQLQANGLPKLLWLGVPIGEVIAPLLLILGIFTRLSSTAIIVTMLMTFVLVHKTTGLSINLEKGAFNAELSLFYLFTSLVIILIGPGNYTILNIKKSNKKIWS